MNIKIKPAYYWFSIFAMTFIAYQLVQDSLRPNYNGDNVMVKYILGIAPNLFPGIGIPALFVLLIPEIYKHKQDNKWLNTERHITANIVSLLGLLSWEFLQPVTTRGTFDWNDVLWTLIGAMIFQIIWMATSIEYKGVNV